MKNLTIFLLAGLATALPTSDGLNNLSPRGVETENQLKDGTPCRPTSLLFARGANSPGNMGAGGPGVAIVKRMRQVLGADNIACQGVDYDSNIAMGIVSGIDSGGTFLAQIVKDTAARCPNSKILVSGYSLGTEVVYNGVQKMPQSSIDHIVGVFLYGPPNARGDPNGVGGLGAANKPKYGYAPRPAFPKFSRDDVLIDCHPKDNICDGGPDQTGAHQGYDSVADTDLMANFIMSKIS